MPHLIELMGSKHTGLACAAAAALMMITVVREGKYAVVDTAPLGGFQKVVSALNPTKPQLCTDAMQVRDASDLCLCAWRCAALCSL